MSYGPPFTEAEIAARRKTDQLFANLRRLIERSNSMRRTPDEASDETINQLFMNTETILGNKPVSCVIDLQRKYAFVTRMVGRYRKPQYECIDTLTYDPDPDSRWHCVGYGETEGEAKGDLLEKIAYAVAHE